MRKFPRLATAGIVLAASAIVTVAPLPGNPLAGAASECGVGGTPTVEALQSPNFYIDIPRDQLYAQFAGYRVGANGTARSGMWIKVDNFTGGVVRLGSEESGEQPIDDLGSAEDQARFFLLEARSETTTAQTHTITIYQGPPARGGTALCSTTFSYDRVVDTIAAKANKVTSVAASTSTQVRIGELVTITVNGKTGTLGAGPSYDPGALNYTPTALSTFPSAAWRLEHTRLVLSPGTAAEESQDDELHWLSSASGPNRDYTATYTFRAVGPAVTATPVVPIQYIASGTQIKHTALAGGYPSLPAVDSTFEVTLDKTVDRPTISTIEADQVVNYTLTLTNNENIAARIDTVVDTLPSGSTYETDSLYVGASQVDPTSTSPDLVIPGPLTVPAKVGSVPGTLTITYTVDLGVTTGTRVNSAIAEFGSVVFDHSADTLNSDPATASVVVYDPNPAVSVSKSAGEVEDTAVDGVADRADAGDTITYTYTVSNIGTDVLSAITVLDDKIDNDATNILCAGSSSPFNVIASITVGGADVECTADYVITQDDIDAGEVENTVTVTASGTSESVSDTDTVTKLLPAVHSLEIDKTGELDMEVAGPTDRADADDVVTYTYVISNLGNVTEYNVVLTDNKIADADLSCDSIGSDTDGDNSIDVLAPGESVECTGDYVLLQDDLDAGYISNIATVESDDTDGEGYETVDLVAVPELAVAKSGELDMTVVPPSSRPDANDVVTYTYEVENLGNVTETNVTLTDDKIADDAIFCDGASAPTNVIPAIAPGETVTCTAEYALTQDDLDNGGVDNTGSVVSDLGTEADGDESIDLAADPELSASKIADRAKVQLVGEVINYTIVVSNTGNVTMSDVQVTDPLVGTLACTPGAGVEGANGTFVIAPGELVTCIGSYTVTEADIVSGSTIPNTATATGHAPSDETTYEATADVSVGIDPLLSDIAGRVWIDTNTNGTYDAGDVPLIDMVVTATLLAARNGGVAASALPTQTLSAMTDSTGSYRFSNLRAGTYRVTVANSPVFVYQIGDTDGGTDWAVVVDAPPALAASGGSISTQTNGGTAQADFRAQGPGTIVGNTYDPTTGYGYPFSSVTCRWAGRDGLMGNGDDWVFRTTSDRYGVYQIPHLPFGSYHCEGVTAGGKQTIPADVQVPSTFWVNAPLPLPTVLPKTGLDIRRMLEIAALLIGSGLVLLRPRRRALARIRR